MFYRRLKPKAFMRSSPVPLIDWALRRYDAGPDEIGQEADPAEYIAALVDVFRGVRRVLRGDGVCLVNLGDSYSSGGGIVPYRRTTSGKLMPPQGRAPAGDLPEKNLLLLPFRVALALQADGWYVRSVIVWEKMNCMPESVTDRPTTAHEYWFMLAKQPRYHWDAEAVRMPYNPNSIGRYDYALQGTAPTSRQPGGDIERREREKGTRDPNPAGRNFRTSDPWRASLDLAIEETRARLAHLEAIKARGGLLVDEDDAPLALSVTTAGYAGAHYATFPPKLIEPLLLASVPRECCSVCGAAWIRVIERERDEKTETTAHTKAGVVSQTNHTYRQFSGGFASSCPHDAPTVPGVVLDPFAGSGTTGQVALKHGRRAVLIELNAEYIAEHIEERTNGVQVTLPLE